MLSAMKQPKKKKKGKEKKEGEQDLTDLSHCDVQGRGFCSSDLKKGATKTLTETRLHNRLLAPASPKAGPQAAGGTIPCFLREQSPATIMGKAAHLRAS